MKPKIDKWFANITKSRQSLPQGAKNGKRTSGDHHQDFLANSENGK
jgi:hypothetical protein